MTDTNLIHDPKGGMPRLLEIMRALRDPETGCPWDVAQDFASIAPYTIEEAYEVADAIERAEWDELRGELGDLLFQSVFHAQMASERGLFDFDDVANTMSDKMVARHPHVFGDQSNAKSAEQQTKDWETIKAAERLAKPKGVRWMEWQLDCLHCCERKSSKSAPRGSGLIGLLRMRCLIRSSKKRAS